MAAASTRGTSGDLRMRSYLVFGVRESVPAGPAGLSG
jgi:hypothetical protein